MTITLATSLVSALPDLIGSASAILVIGAAFLLVELYGLRAGRAYVTAAALLFLAAVLFCRASSGMIILDDRPDLILSGLARLLKVGFPYLSLAVLVLGALLEWKLVRRLRVVRQGRITSASVKQAVDALPDGVCFSDVDGVPLLLNAQMDALAHDAFGVALTNERALWERLCASDCLEGYTVENADGVASADDATGVAGANADGSGMLLVADDGRAWHISRKELSVNGRPVIETLATDVTEEYGLVWRLEDQNRRIAAVNERMRAYGRDLTRLTREEEVLAMKVRVHDEVGRALIALRTYERQEGEARNREALLDLWRKVAHLLEDSGTEETMSDDWALLKKAAEAIGVSIVMSGELPAGADARKLAVAIVHECLNNAVRHGNAREVRVTCEVSNGVVELEVANDGAAPATPAVESGGLANLRSAVERAGGILNVCWEPQVVVRARFDEEARWQRHGSSSWMTSA